MSFRLYENDNSGTSIIIEPRISVTATERSWGYSDPLEELAEAALKKIYPKNFKDSLLRKLSSIGLDITSYSDEIAEDIFVSREGSSARADIILHIDIECSNSNFTQAEAVEVQKIAEQILLPKNKTCSVIGLIVDGYPIEASDVDNKTAEVESYFSAFGVWCNGETVMYW